MELNFFSRTRMLDDGVAIRWATICCTDEDFLNYFSSDWEGCFRQYSEETILGLPVWHSTASDVQKDDYDEIRKMITTLNDCKSQVIFACTYSFFMRCLHYSYYEDEQSDYLDDVGVYVTMDNRLLYHAYIGENRCVLIVAFKGYDEE